MIMILQHQCLNKGRGGTNRTISKVLTSMIVQMLRSEGHQQTDPPCMVPTTPMLSAQIQIDHFTLLMILAL